MSYSPVIRPIAAAILLVVVAWGTKKAPLPVADQPGLRELNAVLTSTGLSAAVAGPTPDGAAPAGVGISLSTGDEL